MSLEQSLLAFAIAGALLTITPGLDTALVLRTATAEGARAAFLAGAGICLGCLFWGVAVAFGLGAVLQASELAYTALKWAGALYLAYLGIMLLLRSRTEPEEGGGAEPPQGRQWFVRGFMTNLLNPKVGVFYVAFLPQFIPEGSNVQLLTMVLAAIHAGEGLLWFIALVLATRPLARVLKRPKVVRALDRLVGTVFLLFALRLVFSRT